MDLILIMVPPWKQYQSLITTTLNRWKVLFIRLCRLLVYLFVHPSVHPSVHLSNFWYIINIVDTKNV